MRKPLSAADVVMAVLVGAWLLASQGRLGAVPGDLLIDALVWGAVYEVDRAPYTPEAPELALAYVSELRPCYDWSADLRPVPLIAFHGTDDPIVPYDGAPPSWLSTRPFASVAEWTTNWARRNRCNEAPIESVAAADVTRLEYADCAEDATVVLYTIRGGGHAWPGGKPMPAWVVGPTTRSIDATRLMWAFFGDHPLRRE